MNGNKIEGDKKSGQFIAARKEFLHLRINGLDAGGDRKMQVNFIQLFTACL